MQLEKIKCNRKREGLTWMIAIFRIALISTVKMHCIVHCITN